MYNPKFDLYIISKKKIVVKHKTCKFVKRFSYVFKNFLKIFYCVQYNIFIAKSQALPAARLINKARQSAAARRRAAARPFRRSAFRYLFFINRICGAFASSRNSSINCSRFCNGVSHTRLPSLFRNAECGRLLYRTTHAAIFSFNSS